MSRDGRYSNGGGSAASRAAQRMISNEPEYKKGIEEVERHLTLLAETITKGGTVETILGDQIFVGEMRENIKTIAIDNVSRKRKIGAFISSVREVRTMIQTAAAQDEDGEDEAADYEATIKKKMAEAEAASVEEDPNDTDFVRHIKDKLGDKNDDEEMEIMANQAGESEQSMKCPITAAFLEDPVKTNSCGHTFSRAGIMGLLRGKTFVACPCYGCGNTRITEKSLVDDKDAELRIRRYRNRQEYEKRHLDAAYEDFDDEDEDGEEVHQRPTVL
eukprot:CAMPEP_0113314022 /NCGR_PEP_ID=MMETSP0010_2-20120614/10238_1 /TAXON_ID=216773 ORGANISM="Corethron hystrix, Strain 308" /NCGR_SAMPLE_ID=MMETSP0010_2 /ASSEMBLY_ACC=CAM_ASM_000155 /LENGTH=273 /DNA_ID=CAMNT_0000170203 /DNA_START=40 /DNA_END=861 /DNA_ORIENTATION=- /assembly_acc=CAM_ASM_000155